MFMEIKQEIRNLMQMIKNQLTHKGTTTREYKNFKWLWGIMFEDDQFSYFILYNQLIETLTVHCNEKKGDSHWHVVKNLSDRTCTSITIAEELKNQRDRVPLLEVFSKSPIKLEKS